MLALLTASETEKDKAEAEGVWVAAPRGGDEEEELQEGDKGWQVQLVEGSAWHAVALSFAPQHTRSHTHNTRSSFTRRPIAPIKASADSVTTPTRSTYLGPVQSTPY